METESALVRSDSAVELDTVAEVGLDLTVVVDPSHAESEDTVRLDKPFDNLRLFKLRMLVIDILDGFKNLLYGLKVFLLGRVLGLETGHDLCGLHDDKNSVIY